MTNEEIRQALEQSLHSIGAPANLYFTERQLYYEVCRTLIAEHGRKYRRSIGLGAASIGVATMSRYIWPNSSLIKRTRIILDGIGAGLLLQRTFFHLTRPGLPLPYEMFQNALLTYGSHHGYPAQLLRELPPSSMLASAPEPDLADYGLLRLLIVQDAAIAYSLRANQLHSEMACIVLSLADATPLPDPVCAMLARTPRASIYFLHDASSAGIQLIAELPERLMLPGHHQVRAIGLRPAHAQRLRLFTMPSLIPFDCPPSIMARLSQREIAWLQTGRSAELAALPPIVLLQFLHRVIRVKVEPLEPRFHLLRSQYPALRQRFQPTKHRH